MKRITLLVLIGITSSCADKKNDKFQSSSVPEVIEANGYIVSPDSVAKPQVILINQSALTIKPAGKPQIIPANTNIHLAGVPQEITAGTPQIHIPGNDSFLIPPIVTAIDSPFIAGKGIITPAKDPYIKDENPGNFSIYDKLRGLLHDQIRCIIQDKQGNIWFGTGGGVSKFDGKFFTHYTEKEGLISNNISAMLQDKNGNIWIATSNGVTRFDGIYFTNFTENQGLINNSVYTMAEEKNGNIWFGTLGSGASKYDGHSFTNFTVKQGLPSNRIYTIFQDSKENIWFGTNGAGVVKYNHNTFENFTDKQGLSNNNVYSIFEDKKGNLWFGTLAGVNKYNSQSFTHYTYKEGLPGNNVYSILQDNTENLWFSTDSGVCKFKDTSFTHFTDKNGLSKNSVLSSLHDRNGNLWFGTLNGVNKFNGNIFSFYTKNQGLPNYAVFGITKDKAGNLWFATFGSGVSKYDGNSFTNYSENEALNNNYVYSVLEDNNNNLWFSYFGGGISKFDGKQFTQFTEKDGLINNKVICAFQDNANNIWFGTYGGVSKYDGKSFTNYTKKQGLSANRVYTVFQDKEGNMWFGTVLGGLTKFDGKQFTHFTQKEGLLSNTVSAICQDTTGIMWIATAAGICKYDGKTFTRFTEKQGLSDNIVFSILQDKNQNLWFGTRTGLSKLSATAISKINLKTENEFNHLNLFKSYTYDDGFLGVSCYSNSICQDNKGTIWIGTNDRLTAYYPQQDNEDTIPPIIQLTGIQLFNQDINWPALLHKQDSSLTLDNGVNIKNFHFSAISKWYALPEKLSLTYNNNYLTFNFIGITQKSPTKVKYQYKLLGFDDKWSSINSTTSASYANLPHGKFTFSVKALNADGFWSNEYNYTFTITPPWWKTYWAYALYIISIAGSIWFYILWREKSLKIRQKELETQVTIATEEIREQKFVVEEKNRHITDSIQYALRIQTAILPPEKLVKEHLKNSFVLYIPKDIVAGDFYWMETVEANNSSIILFAACDCTGHGVPGAMVSVMCHNALNRAVREYRLTQPAKILDKVVDLVQDNFTKSENEIQDGMDTSLCAYYPEQRRLEWAGANNPLWIIRNNQIIEYKPDKQPIGKYEYRKPYTNHQLELQHGDTIYIFSDGYHDQFGDNGEKKLTKKGLKQILLSIQHLNMEQQREELTKLHTQWKGQIEQIDDICVIGVRV